MKRFTALLAAALFLPAGCSISVQFPNQGQFSLNIFCAPAPACTPAPQPAPPVQPTPAAQPAPAVPPAENAQLLTTQIFESGELTFDKVSAPSLESFLQDLNRRKDYDYCQHDNQPGPDADYLWNWVQNVTAELQSRGYALDEAGNLSRPDGVPIPMR